MNKLVTFFLGDRLFLSAFILAVISCLLGQFRPSYIDFKVVLSLFGLMLIINGLEDSGFLNKLAAALITRSATTRTLVASITFLSFFSSMLLTNDVAILTMMPIYLNSLKKLPAFKGDLLGAVLIVVAANLGSSFFPFGNPQNLFLFSYFALSAGEFFAWTSSLAIIFLIGLAAVLFFIPSTPLHTTLTVDKPIKNSTVGLLAFLMLLMVLAIFGVLPYIAAVVLVTGCCLVLQPKLLGKVDYRLLLTFVCFFLIIGNVKHWDAFVKVIQPLFRNQKLTYLWSIGLSQIISNVPAAILIAPFSTYHHAILFGVNIGGLGTLIASLANLIGYKLVGFYLPERQKEFFQQFTCLNLILLFIFGTVFYFLV